MFNPKTQKNYSNQAMQKQLSGKANNKIKGSNINHPTNINKPGSKPQSHVEKKKIGTDKNSDKNIRNSYKNPNSHINHVNQVMINFSSDIKKHINQNNQINLKQSNKKNEMNPITYQLMFKNQFGNQNQGGKQNQIGRQNPVVKHNQSGIKNQVGMPNQRGLNNQDVKPVIMRKNIGQINGQKIFNKDNNKNFNANMNIDSVENKINFNGNNQQKFRGKQSPNQTPNQPKNKSIEFVQLSREDKTFYINSILYCLANNEKISKYLFDNYKNEKFGNSQRLITFLFWRIIFHLNVKDKSEYSLKEFYKNVSIYNPILKGNNSKNLVGFLIFLLENFHEEDKKFRNINQEKELKEEIYTNKNKFQNYLKICEDTFVYNNYGWVNEKKVKCLVCNNETITYSFFFTYDLNISSAINKYIIKLSSGNKENSQNLTIRKCLDYNAEQERLYNVYCKSCDKKTNLERQNLIQLLSDNIIILLSGIEQRDIIDLIKENNIIIKVDKNLEINNKQYRINSVIYYDVNNKKYLNYCYKKNKWIKYTYVDIKEEINEDFLNKADINVVPVVIFYSLNK